MTEAGAPAPDRSSLKAEYIRQKREAAAAELAELEAARKDLLAAAALEPADRTVRSKLAECKALVASARECERALYQRALSDGSRAGTMPLFERAAGAGATQEGKAQGATQETEEVEAGLAPIFDALEEVD